MPVYKSIGQNTYVFKTETQFNFNQDLTNPARGFALPIVKVWMDDEKKIYYTPCAPSLSSSNTKASLSLSNSDSYTSGSSNDAYARGRSNAYFNHVVKNKTISLENNKYTGLLSSEYYFRNRAYDAGSTIPRMTVFPFNLKAIKYEAASNTIITTNNSYALRTANSRDLPSDSSGKYYYGYSFGYITVPKVDNDMFLGFESEFTNATITLSVAAGKRSGLQYSTDDGITWTAWDSAKESITLTTDQVKLKNTSSMSLVAGSAANTSLYTTTAKLLQENSELNIGIFGDDTITIS